MLSDTRHKKKSQAVVMGDDNITLQDFDKVLFEGAVINISQSAMARVSGCFDFLKSFSRDKIIYGINTGFGPMAQHKILSEDRVQLQYNLIRSHSCGSGNTLPPVYSKAIMLARLNTLLKGFSGIHPDAVELLKDLINNNISPVIYEHGGVGASGDLVQLAHLALAMIGEGDVVVDEQVTPAKEALKRIDCHPLKIRIREGLSLINGTSVMSAIGIINILRANRLLQWSLIASCMINEVVESYDDHFSEELNRVKLHRGQNKIAGFMRNILSDSKRIKKRDDHLYNPHVGNVIEGKVQEYYSLRCVPQILGPVYDTLSNAENTLLDEINSANDNPIIDVESKNIYHGGNFHGDYVAFEMDKLKIAITKLTMLAERQLNYLLNDKLNEMLPPFINSGIIGLNFGLQGLQFTATSTTAENQSLSNPMYVHSIPCNNGNQDIVSMGSNAALMARKAIDNAFQVIAIEWMAILQAIDYLEIYNQLSRNTKKVYKELRQITSPIDKDLPQYKEIAALTKYLKNNESEIYKMLLI